MENAPQTWSCSKVMLLLLMNLDSVGKNVKRLFTILSLKRENRFTNDLAK